MPPRKIKLSVRFFICAYQKCHIATEGPAAAVFWRQKLDRLRQLYVIATSAIAPAA
jgi:hypothetical protein